MSTEQIDSLGDFVESEHFNDLEKAVITFADQLTRKATADKTVTAKLKESLTAEHLVKLACTVGEANWTNRFNNAFGVELP